MIKDILKGIGLVVLIACLSVLITVTILITGADCNRYIDGIYKGCIVTECSTEYVSGYIDYGEKTISQMGVRNTMSVEFNNLDTDEITILEFNPVYIPDDLAIGDTVDVFTFDNNLRRPLNIKGDRHVYRYHGKLYE